MGRREAGRRMSAGLRRAYYLLRLSRPLFLAGGFVFYGLGVAAALYDGLTLHWPVLLWGQVAVTAIQLMTHFSNDYFDLAADRLNESPTRWSGGSRVLPEGLLPPPAALWAAVAMAAVALTATAALALVYHQPIWPIALLLAAQFLAWEYSAPPLRLLSRGLGEATVALIVPVLTPLVGYALQAGRPGLLPLLASFPLAGLQAAMILVVNFPDAEADRRAGKVTLVVRLGEARAARLHPLLLAAAYLPLPALVGLGLPPLVAAAVLLPLPLGLWLALAVGRAGRGGPADWSRLAFWSIGLLMSTAGLELAAFILTLVARA
jgi:1,4-dihydroxy-2-naphthoate octaprenyltransferase